MPKKIKNCFDSNLTFEKLLQAHQRARKNKTYKNEIINFEINLENNLINLMNKIKNNTYHLGKYFNFKVFEPKERIIKCLPYVDRVVHQWYVEEFIKPYIVPKFINNTFACLKNKGTHKAVNNLQKQLQIYNRKHLKFWILKCDIKKFFYSIDPYILFDIMKKYISDKKLLNLTKILIFEGNDSLSNKGIPIGNYSSQFFANIYMNKLDQYVKHVLKIQYYTRYMDDFILLAKSKSDCIYLKNKIELFLHNKLQIELNHKSNYYPSSMGVNFCGYRIYTTHKLLRNDSKKKIKRKVKNWNNLYTNNKLNIPNTIQCINSWLGHSQHCNSYKLQNKILENCDFLITNKYYENIEKYQITLIENAKKENLLL